jgi:hypothetical protein
MGNGELMDWDSTESSTLVLLPEEDTTECVGGMSNEEYYKGGVQ